MKESCSCFIIRFILLSCFHIFYVLNSLMYNSFFSNDKKYRNECMYILLEIQQLKASLFFHIQLLHETIHTILLLYSSYSFKQSTIYLVDPFDCYTDPCHLALITRVNRHFGIYNSGWPRFKKYNTI